MDFSAFPTMQNLSKMLNGISERQKVISNNMANAQTPGYTAKEVSFSQVLEKLDSPFETRLSQKMGSTQPLEMSTGQPVNLQHELIEMQHNLLFYSMATRRLSTMVTLLKTASQIGR
jgi:flagellar basal-body rod protein FlgB